MIKTLAKSIREYKTSSILSPIFVSFEVILECLMPLVIVWFLDALEDPQTIAEGRVMEVILTYGGALLGMAVLSLAAGMASGRFAARASAGFAKNLRKDMYYAIQDYSFANIDRFSTSSLVTPSDDGRDQRADGVHDDHPRGDPLPVHAHLFAHHVLYGQRPHFLPSFWRSCPCSPRCSCSSSSRRTPSSSASSTSTTT